MKQIFASMQGCFRSLDSRESRLPKEIKAYVCRAAPQISLVQPYHVKKGQTLCIVEAMKLMNEITAEEDGIISEICVANDQVVEFGTELFRMKR